jgi:DNA-binding NarL/FixJ family response regulator
VLHISRAADATRVAEELRISEGTVKFHMTDILDKPSVGALGEAADLAHA